MDNIDLTQQLMNFLDAAPTPYHAVHKVRDQLVAHGFEGLHERESWQLKPGGKYFVTRRDASILAFVYGTQPLTEDGLRIIGAHTDSPTLKVKPQPEKLAQGYLQLGIETYGGVLLNPWFDRDLSIAGRVTLKGAQGLEHRLINFERPVAVIPSLAIHLDRSANENRSVNPQEQMRPLILQTDNAQVKFRTLLAKELERTGIPVPEADILEFDLNFYDVQRAAFVGLEEEFLASARIDNLLSCCAGLQALLHSSGEHSAVLALFDHEEVGSRSDIGADSNLLSSFIERLAPTPELRYRLLANSMLMSVDNAHGIHPNFPQKHDERHGPLLNRGPVIKTDANQSYATSSASAGYVRLLAEQANVPLQSYVTRADMRCGSTIGPMTAAGVGLQTVDLGVPTFAMHSIRELAGSRDFAYLCAILEQYLESGSVSL